MPRTFDIRFARATGLAAILEAPANTFRWRGVASLRIDDTGLEIAPKRDLYSLFARRPRFRINTADLREVSRAADALRIEFGMPGARRAVVPFWAPDPGTAAEIMRLVPTHRTIETDEPVADDEERSRRPWMFLALLAVAVIGVGVWVASRPGAPPAIAAEPAQVAAPASAPAAIVDRPAAPLAAPAQPASPVAAAAPVADRAVPVRVAETVEPTSDVTPDDAFQADAPLEPAPVAPPAAARTAIFTPGDPMYDAAIRQFDGFQSQAAHFYTRYLDGSTPLPELAASWDQFSQAITASPEYREPRLRPMIDDEIAAAAAWSRALAELSEARNSRDTNRIARARAELERVSDQTTRVALHIERR